MRYHGGLSTRGYRPAAGIGAASPGLQEAPSPWFARETRALAGRHLFGPPEPADRYAGSTSEAETEDLLARLAVMMVELGRTEIGESANASIPAGYTYLAQLVAHDVVHHTTSLAAHDVNAPDLSGDRRIEPLVLETIYGGGPSASPHVYAVPPGRGEPRSRLRLGTIQGAPLVNPIEPPRDIPRVACPHLNDASYGGDRDVLLGDPRNDDNLVLSQLTVVFHLLHNLVVDRLRTTRDDEILKHLPNDRYAIFRIGHRVVARIYREIVVGDLLKRLLDEKVFKYYHPREGHTEFLDRSDDPQVPLDFAFGAYRFGHAMVRRSYLLNDERGRTGLYDLLQQTSEGRAHAMPLTADWLVQWSHFFDLRPDVTREPAYSRKLGPSFVAPLSRTVEADRTSRGGLAFEDLRSAAAAGLRSVTSLLQAFQRRAPENIFPDHPLYGDPKTRASAITSWLQDRQSWLEERIVLDRERRLEAGHIAALAADPPPLFFVLLEAELVAGGARLGPLGSLIVAESLLPLLQRKRALIEDDRVVAEVADRLFGPDRPQSMPALVNYLADGLDLARPEARFL